MLLPAACCRSNTFVCTGQRLGCSGCIVMYLWSCFKEALCNCPFGYIRGISFHLSVFSFFQAWFSSTRANPGWICMKQTKTRARLIRTCDMRAHPYTFFFLFFSLLLFQLLDKLWSQVSALLPPGTCLQFLSRIGFSIPTARRLSSNVANSRFRAFR